MANNLGNLENLEDKKNWDVVVTNYQDFKKIVVAFIKYCNPNVKTDKDVETFIERGGGEGIIKATYSENKKYFAEGKYVYSQASVAEMNLE